MASDWIKMRSDIYRDPKVSVIAESLMSHDGDLARYVNQMCQRDMTVTRNVMRNVTVGALVSIWGVMRMRGKRNSDDLVCAGVTVSVLDDIADLPGIGSAMEHAGWVVQDDNGITFPNFFDGYNVDPAEKSDSTNAERQRRYRERKAALARGESADVECDERDVTVTPREEKRREEEIKNTPLPPKGGGRDAYTPEFEAAWKAYPDRPNASKADAFKAWNARIRAGVLPEVMTAGAERYAAFCLASRTEPRFVKLPSTFFGPGGHFLAEWCAPEAEPDAALTPGTDEYRSANRHASWVLKAGFSNIWEAENEGCYERNAQLFCDGKKIQAVPA